MVELCKIQKKILILWWYQKVEKCLEKVLNGNVDLD